MEEIVSVKMEEENDKNDLNRSDLASKNRRNSDNQIEKVGRINEEIILNRQDHTSQKGG